MDVVDCGDTQSTIFHYITILNELTTRIETNEGNHIITHPK